MTRLSRLLVAITLLGIGSLFSYRFLVANDFRLTSLDYYDPESFISYPDGRELLAGEKITARFRTPYDNLGTFSLRFDNNFKTSDDVLVFKLKETGSPNWYYQAKYKTDQFLPRRLFDFGFPIIVNSAGKEFEVEIESLNGTSKNGIIVDKLSPTYLARSIYTKKELLQNPLLISGITANKLKLFLFDKNYLVHLLVYFVPLFLFLTSYLSYGMSLHYLILFYFFSSFVSARLPLDLIDLYIASYSVFWFYIATRYKLGKVYTILVSLFFLTLSAIVYGFSIKLANIFSVWFYLILIVYLVESLILKRKTPSETIDIKFILKNLLDFKHDENHLPSTFTVYGLIVGCLATMTRYVYIQMKNVYHLITNIREFGASKLVTFLVCLSFLLFWLVSIYIFKKKVVLDKNHFLNTLKLLLAVSIILFFNNLLVSLNSKKINQPTLFSVQPSQVSEAWVDVSVIGKNLANNPFIGSITIDGVKQEYSPANWTSNRVIFRTNPVTTKSGLLCLTTQKGVVTNCLKFDYDFGLNKP